MKSTLLAFAAVCLMLVSASARQADPAMWGHLPTGADMRRAQLHRAYCAAALEYAIWAARRGHWLDNPRCW